MRRGGTRLLVVDDDDENRVVLGALLTEMGHHAVEARSGRHALELIRSDERFDVIVSDVVMPGMNGMQFAREAQRLSSARIVFVTGNPQVVEDVIVAGNLALLKPYSYEALEHVIDEAIGEARGA